MNESHEFLIDDVKLQSTIKRGATSLAPGKVIRKSGITTGRYNILTVGSTQKEFCTKGGAQ